MAFNNYLDKNRWVAGQFNVDNCLLSSVGYSLLARLFKFKKPSTDLITGIKNIELVQVVMEVHLI